MYRRLWELLALCLAAVPSFAAITGVVMTQEGAPVAGARVSILAYEPGEARRARLLSAKPEEVPIASAQTDAKGAFSLESPKQAVVELAIFARGHVPVSTRIERDEEVGAIVLPKGEMHTGRITAAGKPVPNATVVLRYGDGEIVTRTNEQGRYEAPDARKLRHIAVLHPDYAIDTEMATTRSGVAASELDRTLTAGTTIGGRVVGSDGRSPVAGATIYVDGWPLAKSGEDGTFTIAHAPSKWTQLVARKDSLLGQRSASKEASYTIAVAQGATFSGRVTDGKTKLPIAGAVVDLGGRRFLGRGGMSYAVETDAKGNYSIVALPGTYSLFVGHPSYRPDPFETTAAAGQTVTKDFAPQPLARVSGVVVDEAKKPVAGASVAPVAEDGPMGRMRFVLFEHQATSGPDGRFSLRTTLDTDVTIRASKRGLPPASSERMRFGAGERKSGLVLTIPTGIAVTGRVTDKQNEPLSGVAVTALEAEQGPRGMIMRTIIGGPDREDDAVRTASDGTFTMRLKEGTYDFAFRREGFAPKGVRGQTVSLTTPLHVETSMDPAVEITGRIVRGGTGIENVRVSAFGQGLDSTATTGPDGSFTLTGLPAGPLRLFLRKEDDFIQEQRSATAPANDLVIELASGGVVTGRVTDKSGKAITAFQAGISTSRGGGGMMMMAPPQLRDFTSDDGSFTLDNVPAGAVTLVASAPGYATGRLNLNVEEGKTLRDVEVQLDSGVKLTGRVTGPNGAGLSDVSVRVMPSATGAFAMRGMDPNTVTDQNGEYTLETLLPGEETVQFSHAKYVSTRKQVTLKGRETRLDVQLSSGLRVTGTVVTESGAPVPDAQVEAMSSGLGMQQARTNASGQFEFENMPAGRYRFTALKSGLAQGVAEDVDVSSGAPVRITMSTGGTVYGRVTGLSADELPQATIEVRGTGRDFMTAPVDASGNYRVEGAPTGSVQVSAHVFSRSFMGQKSTKAVTIQLEPGGSQAVDLAFRSDIILRGRVLRNGTPLSNANVSFSPRGAGSMQPRTSTTTDANGEYSVTGLEEGSYTVEVMDMQRFSPYITTYDVRSSATFDIEFRTGSVRGRVLEAGSNAPLANVNVQIRSTTSTERFPFPRGTSTDSAGAFVIDHVPAGSYTITASKDDYGNDVRDIPVGESGVDDLELRLARNDGVTMKVIDARDGRSLRAYVTVYDMQGHVVYDQRYFLGGSGSDETQAISLPLSPGTYSASVGAMNYAPVNLSLQSPSTPVVRLTPGGTLLLQSKHSEPRNVRLLDANGVPYGRISTISPRRALLPSPATTTWMNIAGGTYTLQLLDDNDLPVESRQVVIPEGGTTSADI